MATKLVAELKVNFVFATASEKVKDVARELCDIFELVDTKRNPRKRKVINVAQWDQIDECLEKAERDISIRQDGNEFIYEYWNGYCYHTLVSVFQFQGC